MFYYVYILLLKNNMLYTGSTGNLKTRFNEHSQGNVKSTKHLRPIKLIHYEAYLKRVDALRRKRYLKTTEGRHFLYQQLKVLFEQLKIK